MNGRAYDYNLGRFLSVDPFIQSPGNSQSLNPYSYIMNNPLAGTDPTGYCAKEVGSKVCQPEVKIKISQDGEKANINLSGGTEKQQQAVAKEIVNTLSNSKPQGMTDTNGLGQIAADNKTSEQNTVSLSPVAAGAAVGGVKESTAQSRVLQESGKFLHSDGTIKKSGFKGNQRKGYSAEEVINSKQTQIRKAQLNKVASSGGNILLAYSLYSDSEQWVNGDISDSRFSYRMVGTASSILVGLASGPFGIVVGVAFPAGEITYDTTRASFKEAQNRENIHTMTDFNQTLINFMSGRDIY